MLIDYKRSATKAALESGSISYTYEQLELLVTETANRLTSLGIHRGHKVAFLAHTTLNVVVLLLSLERLKAIACPINPKEKPSSLPSILTSFHTDFFLDSDSLSILQKFPATRADLDEDTAILLRTSGSSHFLLRFNLCLSL